MAKVAIINKTPAKFGKKVVKKKKNTHNKPKKKNTSPFATQLKNLSNKVNAMANKKKVKVKKKNTYKPKHKNPFDIKNIVTPKGLAGGGIGLTTYVGVDTGMEILHKYFPNLNLNSRVSKLLAVLVFAFIGDMLMKNSKQLKDSSQSFVIVMIFLALYDYLKSSGLLQQIPTLLGSMGYIFPDTYNQDIANMVTKYRDTTNANGNGNGSFSKNGLGNISYNVPFVDPKSPVNGFTKVSPDSNLSRN